MLSIGLNSPLGVAALPLWLHLVGAAALFVLGLIVFFGLGLLLDGAATRHIFHFRYWANCGRCESDRQLKREREHQKWLKKRGGLRHPPAALSIEKPKGWRA